MSSPSDTERAIHETTLVLDGHADVVLPETGAMYLDADGESKVSPAKMRAGGVDAVVMSLAVGPGGRSGRGLAAAQREMAAKVEAVLALVAADDALVIATTADELVEAKAAGSLAFVLGFQNARSIGDDLSLLDHYDELGARVFALNHLGHNDHADSSRPAYNGKTGTYEPDSEHGGLSALGVAATEHILSLGGVVDVSQLSRSATLQTIEMCHRPVIASHSNVQALCNVRRNLSDTEIDAIGANGGVINVSAFMANLLDFSEPTTLAAIQAARTEARIPVAFDYPFELYWEIDDRKTKAIFLQTVSGILGSATIDHMVDHIDHIVARIGIDHVGIGTDFNHGGGMVDGFDNAAEAANVTAGLLRRGYSADDVAKIWSGNFLRVLRSAEVDR